MGFKLGEEGGGRNLYWRSLLSFLSFLWVILADDAVGSAFFSVLRCQAQAEMEVQSRLTQGEQRGRYRCERSRERKGRRGKTGREEQICAYVCVCVCVCCVCVCVCVL